MASTNRRCRRDSESLLNYEQQQQQIDVLLIGTEDDNVCSIFMRFFLIDIINQW